MNSEPTKNDAPRQENRTGIAGSNGHGSHDQESPIMSRRRFLEAAGFSMSISAFAGCSREPSQVAMPLTSHPEGMRPGRMQYYASTGTGSFTECGMLIGVRDGRPLKMEGMPEHPLSRGGLSAVAQAMPIELYDSHRLKKPRQGGEDSNWAAVDKAILAKLKTIREGSGAVRFVTSTVTSPTLQRQIDKFLEQFDDSRHVVFDAVSSSAILDAHQKTHGVRVLPHYKLDKAKVIVSFGADFLGTWISPVEFTAAWRTHRVPTEEQPEMSYHVQLEGRMSLTGSNADRRFRLAPDEYGIVLSPLVGKNAALFIEPKDDTLRYTCGGVTIQKTDKRRELATTQEYDSMDIPAEVAPHGAERREIVQTTTLPAFATNPKAGTPADPPGHHDSDVQLWPDDHPKTGHAWGMVIDMNTCTGCSGCVIACQSENNIPAVGWDEVRRQRDMHWIRIDRYYTGEGDDVDVHHQPMMCQHCDNAPCETVCPALATVHSEEGLNEQVYNRCVGTRYCANNCPYKVRRFNWFLYPQNDPDNTSMSSLAFNPDVTVRSRGVMEKCSMCVQRIQAGKIEAKRQGIPLADGAVQTACEQSCPAQAIVFGDMNDPESAVSKALENPRQYRLLEEFNFQPGVAYQRVVRNREVDEQEVTTEGHG